MNTHCRCGTSATLPARELDRAIAAWSRDPALTVHLRNARLLKLINSKQPARARTLASSFDGHRYLLFPVTMNLDSAASTARSLGGHLATITSRAELDFVQSYAGWQWIWLDLVTDQPGLRWRNGEPAEFIAGALLKKQRAPWVLTAWGVGLQMHPMDKALAVVEWDE